MSTIDEPLVRFRADLQYWTENDTPTPNQLRALVWALAVDSKLKEKLDVLVVEKRSECGKATQPPTPPSNTSAGI